jgi:hypothetical protein
MKRNRDINLTNSQQLNKTKLFPDMYACSTWKDKY